jgi:hypothetical protein
MEMGSLHAVFGGFDTTLLISISDGISELSLIQKQIKRKRRKAKETQNWGEDKVSGQDHNTGAATGQCGCVNISCQNSYGTPFCTEYHK